MDHLSKSVTTDFDYVLRCLLEPHLLLDGKQLNVISLLLLELRGYGVALYKLSVIDVCIVGQLSDNGLPCTASSYCTLW